MKTTSLMIGGLLIALALSGQAVGDARAPVAADAEIAEMVGTDNPFACLKPSTAESLAMGDLEAVPAVCDNGEFQRTTSIGISHGFTGVPYAQEQWTGIMQSWLRHDGDDRGFECEFELGALVACQGLGGAFPGMDPFQHECLAFESSTGLLLPIAETGFGCAISGNIVQL